MSQNGPARILYMEDDPGLARLFQKKLQRSGYLVDLAPDGEEGLATYENGSYDVLAVDQTMPRCEGLEVIRALASRGPVPPVVMITGTGNERIAVEAMKLGASDYIVKDADGGYLDLLPTVIERVLHQRRLVKEKEQAEAERDRLLAAERQQRLLAETLAEMTMALASLTSRAALLEEILRQAQAIVPSDAADIALLEGETLRIAHHRGNDSRESGALSLGSPWTTADSPLDFEAIRSRQPSVVCDTHEAVRLAAPDQPAWVRSYLSVPICRNGTVLGLLRLRGDTPDEFTAEDAERLKPFVSAAAIALENSRLLGEVQRLAITDELTGLHNRRHLYELSEHELRRARRRQEPVSAIMLDIDRFKSINDTYGHALGDSVLRALADCCRRNVRDHDILGRYGGEEFVIVLPATDLPAARNVAERVRRCIAGEAIPTEQGDLRITISAGVATYDGGDPDVAALIERADAAMYAAKRAGRNRVELAVGDGSGITP